MNWQNHFSAGKCYTVQNGALCIGSEYVGDLLSDDPQTPCYIYQKAVIQATVERLRTYLPNQLQLLYSVKANPYPPVIEYLSELVDGFDTASAGELAIVKKCTDRHSLTVMTGPGKSDDDLEACLRHEAIINLESEQEWIRTCELADKQPHQVRVMLRLNPDFELRSSGMKMSGGPRPFGVDLENCAKLIQHIIDSDLDFIGVHMFCGSQCLDSVALVQAHHLIFDRITQLKRETGAQFAHINIGGGLGIPYFEHERPLALGEIGENLETHILEYLAEFGKAQFHLELGRYLVGEAGIYVCRILDIKESRGKQFVITNGGMHHHLAASGNLGQVVRKNYPVVNASKMNGPTRRVTIVGPLCTPLDIIADNIDIGAPTVGDYIAVFQSGAYGLTASPTGFLSHPPCRQILV